MKIKLFLTGGTIDKRYNMFTGELDYTKTYIQEMLARARCRADIDIEELMLLDSLDMTEDQRQQILQACNDSSEARILITHGTDTIVKTAQLLGKNIQDKTIVLFGAMTPFVFGAALAAVQTLSGGGVHISMNGKIFQWDNVVKNRELGEFQALKLEQAP